MSHILHPLIAGGKTPRSHSSHQPPYPHAIPPPAGTTVATGNDGRGQGTPLPTTRRGTLKPRLGRRDSSFASHRRSRLWRKWVKESFLCGPEHDTRQVFFALKWASELARYTQFRMYVRTYYPLGWVWCSLSLCCRYFHKSRCAAVRLL